MEPSLHEARPGRAQARAESPYSLLGRRASGRPGTCLRSVLCSQPPSNLPAAVHQSLTPTLPAHRVHAQDGPCLCSSTRSCLRDKAIGDADESNLSRSRRACAKCVFCGTALQQRAHHQRLAACGAGLRPGELAGRPPPAGAGRCPPPSCKGRPIRSWAASARQPSNRSRWCSSRYSISRCMWSLGAPWCHSYGRESGPSVRGDVGGGRGSRGGVGKPFRGRGGSAAGPHRRACLLDVLHPPLPASTSLARCTPWRQSAASAPCATRSASTRAS
jgi:hypothetical protein